MFGTHPKTSLVVDALLKTALGEDVGSRDLTTSALIAKNVSAKAGIVFGQAGVLCGLEIAERVFRLADERLRFLPVANDGEWIEPKREIAYIEGPAFGILVAERTALNFLGRLSGIATRTRAFIERVQGTPSKILDTRKTTPGLRALEKYAVVTGGGVNHRMGLYDEVLIKDNHLRVLRKSSLVDLVDKARQAVLKKTVIGVEVKNFSELKEALKSKADYILLDNLKPEEARQAVYLRKRMGIRTPFEISGGVTLDNVRDFAQTGVERISVGGLTHGASWVDVSLDIVG